MTQLPPVCGHPWLRLPANGRSRCDRPREPRRTNEHRERNRRHKDTSPVLRKQKREDTRRQTRQENCEKAARRTPADEKPGEKRYDQQDCARRTDEQTTRTNCGGDHNGGSARPICGGQQPSNHLGTDSDLKKVARVHGGRLRDKRPTQNEHEGSKIAVAVGAPAQLDASCRLAPRRTGSHCAGPHCTGPFCAGPFCAGPFCAGPFSSGLRGAMALEAHVLQVIKRIEYRVNVRNAPLIIAHRGASGYRAEHTRAAYVLAIEQGADAVEPDLVISRDGVLVIRHENEISGTTDVARHPEFATKRTTKVVDGETLDGWFTEDFTWAELSTLQAVERLQQLRPGRAAGGILRLTDLLEILDAAPRRVAMVAEIKHASYFESIGMSIGELVADALKTAGWADDSRLIIESFEKSVLLKIRGRGVRAPLIYLVDSTGAPADNVSMPYSEYLRDEALHTLAAEVDGISVDKAILLNDKTDLVERAHKAGLLVYCWTLRAENAFLAEHLRTSPEDGEFGGWLQEFTWLMRLEVDGVFADQPDLALQARAQI